MYTFYERGLSTVLKNYNAVFARDVFLSLANKLPMNLMLDSVNSQGKFTIKFLSCLSEQEIKALRKECEKKTENVFLLFYTIEENSISCPKELRNFSNFDWNKIISIRFNGDTCPYAFGEDFVHYVSVVIGLKP